MSDADAPRKRYCVGVVKIPFTQRDVAHAVITGEDLHGYQNVMGADTDDADEKFPVGTNTAYAVELTDHEADLFAAASNCRYIEESEAALPERAVGRPTGTLHIPPLDALAWLRTRYVDLRRWHGRDVRVAILDQGTTQAVRNAMGWTLVARTNVGDAPLGPGQELVRPNHLHGCLVAPNGVPAGGLLLDAIISDDDGSAPDSSMAAGIIWAVDNGAKVINLSWNYADSAAAPQVLVDACTYARNNGGVQITWSAGNADLTDLQRPSNLSRTQSNVHSIIAFDPATDRRSFFSSHHAEGSGCTPGVDSLSLDIFGNPTRWNGTSSAAPHAAMLMAMAMTGGQFTPTQVGAAFKANCRPTGAAASDQGGGAYDLHRALSALGAGPTLTTSVGNVTHVDSRGVATTANSYSLTPAAGIQPDDLQIMAVISSHDAKFVLPPGAVLLADAPYKAAYEQGDALAVSPTRLRILAMPYTADQPASVLLSFGGAGWFSAFGVMTLRGVGGLDPERFVPTTKFARTGGSLDTVPVVPATTSDLQVCIFSQRHPSANTGTLSLPAGLTQRGFWRPSGAGAGYTLLMATRQLTDGNRTPSYVSTSNDTTGTWATCTFTVPAGPPAVGGGAPPAPSTVFSRGVAVNGGEYGCGTAADTTASVPSGFSYTNPGTYGSQYIYPTSGDFTYLKSRLPINPITRFMVRMERLTTGVGQALRAAEVTRVTAVLDAAAGAGVGVILAPWNFGAVWITDGPNSVRHGVGSAGLSVAQFADFWLRVAQQWAGHSALVGVDLTNEPVGLSAIPGTTANAAQTWQLAAQTSLNQIRTVSSNLFVWVPTYGFNFQAAPSNHPSGPWIVDSTGRFGYTAHHYAWQMGGDDVYANCVSSAASQGFTAAGNPDALYTRELTHLASLNTWLAGNKYWMGEYGIPTSVARPADHTNWTAFWNRLLTQYDSYKFWATAWSSGPGSGPTDMYAVYYPSGGWATPMNSTNNTAITVEAHPSA